MKRCGGGGLHYLHIYTIVMEIKGDFIYKILGISQSVPTSKHRNTLIKNSIS